MVQCPLLVLRSWRCFLKKGADPYTEDKNGMDCLMLASTLGRAENVTFWLSRFPDWDVNRGNKR